MSTQGDVVVRPNRQAGLTLQRQHELVREISVAWRSAPPAELASWIGDIATTFGRVTIRRGRNFWRLGKWIVTEAMEGVRAAAEAHRNGRLKEHAEERGRTHGQAARNAWVSAKEQLQVLHRAIKDNPGESLPRAMVGALAFVAASGGPDGNGGAPDFDLTLGIDAHRSVFFHSFLAGVVIETLLYALASGIGVLYRHLPSAHDPLWDAVARNKDAYLTAAALGAGAGVAYHLFIDATVQPGAYHGLPFAMPMGGHQFVLGANAVVEALDVPSKRETFAQPSTERRTKAPSSRDDPQRLLTAYKDRARAGVKPETDAEARKRHVNLARQRMRIDDRVAANLSDAEKLIVTRYGKWFGAMDSGNLRPITPDQLHFVDVCRGRAEASSEMETAWLRYLAQLDLAGRPRPGRHCG